MTRAGKIALKVNRQGRTVITEQMVQKFLDYIDFEIDDQYLINMISMAGSSDQVFNVLIAMARMFDESK